MTYTSQKLMSYALTASTKKTGDDGGIAETVEIKIGWDDSIPDFRAAEVGGDYNLEKIDDSTLDGLRANLEVLMANKRCGDFINAVINNLSDKTNISKTAIGTTFTKTYKKFAGSILGNFDRVRNDNGYLLANLSGAAGESNVGAILFNRPDFNPNSDEVELFGVNDVFFPDRPITYSKTGDRMYNGTLVSLKLETTFTLVHELIHSYLMRGNGFLTFSHSEMALAAQAAMKQSGFSQGLISRYKSEDGSWQDAGYFDTALRLNCGDVGL